MFSRLNPTGWAPGDELTAAQINGIDVNQSRAIDATNGSQGSQYTPTSVINVGGSGVMLSGAGDAQWIQVPTMSLSRQCPVGDLLFTVPSSTAEEFVSKATLTSGYPGARLTAPPSTTTQALSGACAVRLRPPCNGAAIAGVSVVSTHAWFAIEPTDLTPATYTIMLYQPAGSGMLNLSLETADNHTISNIGTLTTTAVPTVNVPHPIDNSTDVLGLLIKNAWASSEPVTLVVYSIVATWQITTVQPD